MKDEGKGKKQLISELAELRQRITDLEKAEAERKRAEEALRLQSEIAANIAEGVVLVRTSDAVIVYTNRRFEEMFGYGEGELTGQPVIVLNAPGDKSPEETAKEIIKSLKENGVWYGEVHNIKKDGTPFWCRASVSTIEHSQHGKVWLAVHQDITERKEMQERLLRQERLAVLGQLAGGVGHELRNPLGVISNAVYYLQTILPDADEMTKEYLEMIASEVHRSEKIVSDLLDLSRTKPAEREEVAVSGLVARLWEEQPPPEKVKVTTRIAPDLPPLFVDPRQIGQVLVNLVINAYQAMPEGGRLTIEAKAENDKVYLSITDTGCGISKEKMERLFEPLFSTKAKGIGLGLAVSENLVEVNGGSIEVQSEEGKGSTFTVILPTKEAQA